jgi:hypothetical protein
MADRQDDAWTALVRGLTTAEEAWVRVPAAGLIAQKDPELARRVLEQAMADPDLTVRELASQTLVEHVATDLPTLRRWLRSDNASTRTRAASRILAMVD